jgi:choline dehydrogenase-like flavoprotein
MAAAARYETDVLVIGAGAGGAAAAWALADKGVQVILADAGPEYSPSDFGNSADDWEKRWMPAKDGHQGRVEVVAGQPLEERWRHLRNLSAPRQRLSKRTHRNSYGYSHVRGIGGSTLHFTGWMHRLRPDAMQMKSRFGVAADWPVSYDELEPYYVKAEHMVGVAGPGPAPGRPMSRPYPLPAHPMSTLSQTLASGARKVGMSIVQNPVAAPSGEWMGRPACNYCGCCQRGCERGDKGSSDLVFVKPAVETGKCKVLPRHTLVQLERGPSDELTGAILVDGEGDRLRIVAQHYVLAAGAIETPRLLLAMDGLGNESGQVGRNFMETLAGGMTGMLDRQIYSYRGYPEDSICWDLNAPDALEGIPGGGLICPTVQSANFAGPGRYAERLVEGFGTGFKRSMVEDFGKAAGVTFICESLPNPRSYVDLSESQTDETGHPIARIHSYLPELEIRRLAQITSRAENMLLAAGVDAVLSRFTNYETFSSTHVMGTCRMGNDAQTSVVNDRQRSHRWQNLWIADASIFPSSGSGEGPSLTLHALSMRLADNLTKAS